MRKAIDFFTSKPAWFFLTAAFLWIGFMYFVNNQFQIQWKDIVIEANGMTFDLLVFGALIAWYESKRQRNDRIEHNKRIIEQWRGWENEEGVLRTSSAIEHLEKDGVSAIDLFNCYLKNALIVSLNLQEANLQCANLQGAQLPWTNLYKAALDEADLQNADLQDGNIENATLSQANLSGAKLNGLRVGLNWFRKIEEWKVIGREEIKLKYKIDENGVLRLRKKSGTSTKKTMSKT